MTQEEIRKEIDYILEVLVKPSEIDVDRGDEKGYTWREWVYSMVNELINQHVKEVIGEDEEYNPRTAPALYTRNNLRAEQRKRAGLFEPSDAE